MRLTNPEEHYLWRMYKYWKNGISCRVFKKENAKDVEAMLMIDNMIQEKERVEMELNKARSKL